jgi:hypothetical protein
MSICLGFADCKGIPAAYPSGPGKLCRVRLTRGTGRWAMAQKRFGRRGFARWVTGTGPRPGGLSGGNKMVDLALRRELLEAARGISLGGE